MHQARSTATATLAPTPAQTEQTAQTIRDPNNNGDVIMSGPFSRWVFSVFQCFSPPVFQSFSLSSRSANVGDVVVVSVAVRRLQLCYYYRSCTCPQHICEANRFDHSLEPLWESPPSRGFRGEGRVGAVAGGSGGGRATRRDSTQGKASSSSTLNVINRANFFN